MYLKIYMINKIYIFLYYYEISGQKNYFAHLAYHTISFGVTENDRDIYIRQVPDIHNSKHLFLKTEENRMKVIS